jgi:hypothetical protein
MNPPIRIDRRRFVAMIRILRQPEEHLHVYCAGENVGPGVYQELERGIKVRLPHPQPLPDLNSYQPSRFLRESEPRRLLRWFQLPARPVDDGVLYLAGQRVPAGRYREIERGITVNLGIDCTLPDLQTGQPSRYRRLRVQKVSIRRQVF